MKYSNQNKRVVITGLGVISSLGIGWQEFWKNLIAGKSGISRVTAFDTSPYDRHFAGEVKDFRPEEFLSPKKVRQMGRASQFSVASSKLALEDAKLTYRELKQERSGVIIGTTVGELRLLEEFHDVLRNKTKTVSNNLLSVFPSSSLSATVAQRMKLCGYNSVFTTACASGNYSIGYAYDLIRCGKIDFVLAGGSDSFSRVIFTGFSRLFAMAPEKCQPFDKNRKGMMTGEGAGVLFLETLESAQKRKAKVYAEVLGYGLSCDAHHMTNPSVDGIAKAIKKALSNSKIGPQDVDYISAHGTGTPENDSAECDAIKKVLGDRVKGTPVSSIKSMLGHTMGAASALEAIACCLTIDKGVIAPTINLEEMDPKCAIDCVPNKARKAEVKVALNNSSAFGGNNCCVVFKKI